MTASGEPPFRPFSEVVDEFLRERLSEVLGGEMPASEIPDSSPGLLIPRKLAMHMEVPVELLMDAGAIPDTRERKPVPRRTRVRWHISAGRERAARWAFRRIAGYDVPESDY